VKHVADKLHRRRRQRVVAREAQLGGEDAPLKGRALGPLDEGFPVQEVVLGHGAGRDAFGGVVGEGAVLLEEAAVGGGLRHAGGGG
jgi:hypothetical protein